MRWLLAKDLRILRRSPLLASLLIVYPVIVALLIGIAFSRGPERPRIAFLNQIPKRERLAIGGQNFNLGIARGELKSRVDPVIVQSRSQAEQKVRDGDALGALILPADTIQKLNSTLEQPTVDVIVNEEDPLKARLVDDTIASVLADANRRVSQALTKTNIEYLNLLLKGGNVEIIGRSFHVLGLDKIGTIVREARRQLPPDAPARGKLDEVVRFNELAQHNFGLVNKALAAISEPIRVDKTVLKGSKVPLTTFAASIAAALSLMLVTVLLASASLALEREEHAFARLVRGPLTRGRLLLEKLGLAVVCATVVVLIMLAALSLFISLEWSRFGAWVLASVVAALAFAAVGATIGALAREVPTATLLAFTLLLPVAFLALVPSGVVGSVLYDTARVVSALFPFRPTIDVMGSALYGSGSLWRPLGQLGLLAAGYTALARLALRRFA